VLADFRPVVFYPYFTHFRRSFDIYYVPGMQLRPTVSLYLDVRKKLKNEKFMLKLRVTFNKDSKFIQKYFSTGHSLSEDEWTKFRGKSVPFNLRKMREEVLKFEARANDILNSNPVISIDLFEAHLIGKYSKKAGVSVLFDEVIEKMESEGRISTASAYRCAKVADQDFLEGYERDMIEAGETVTTVGFYLRALRAIYNRAIDKRVVSKELYPFGRHGYRIPRGNNFKKALKRPDKVKLEKVKLKDAQEKRAISFWLFSYYCNGMNFTDMAYLKPADIHDEVITFVRRKTMRTVREVKPIVVPIRPEVRVVLSTYGNHEPYCFGIINDEMTPEQKYRKIQDWIALTNKYVNQVAERVGIVGKVNTYNARHTFATMLLKGKADVKAIQQSLGHRSVSTTESYLADLDIEEAKRISKLL
jgi:integrase/recombinase XerD